MYIVARAAAHVDRDSVPRQPQPASGIRGQSFWGTCRIHSVEFQGQFSFFIFQGSVLRFQGSVFWGRVSVFRVQFSVFRVQFSGPSFQFSGLRAMDSVYPVNPDLSRHFAVSVLRVGGSGFGALGVGFGV